MESRRPYELFHGNDEVHGNQTQLKGGADSLVSLLSTLLVGYIIYWALQSFGLISIRGWEDLVVRLHRVSIRLGLAKHVKKLSRASSSITKPKSALQSVLAPLQRQILDTPAERAIESPPGLGNWDNSCYQNSIIQGFASIDQFQSYLRTTVDTYSSIQPNSTSSVLSRALADLNDADNNGKILWLPPRLKAMSSMQQQDAQEYFAKILDDAEKDVATASKVQLESPGLVGLCTEPSRVDVLPACLAQSPFSGQIAQRVACTQCEYSEGLSMIPLNCLTVSLGRDWEYDLRACLDEYTSLECIEGVECGKCTLLLTEAQLRQMLQQLRSTQEPNEALIGSIQVRLQAVADAIAVDDFSDETLSQKCQITKKNRASATKSRQAIVARAPTALAIHINRSVFDETTGAQYKNPASVLFPSKLDLGPWCLGGSQNTISSDSTVSGFETWSMQATRSMLAEHPLRENVNPVHYELRAVITHYGRHENGHYICYRKETRTLEKDYDSCDSDRWWRISDEDVVAVSEHQVLAQGGVFMLFYERVYPAATLNGTADSLLASSTLFVEQPSTIVTTASESPAHADLNSGPMHDDKSATDAALAAPLLNAEKAELLDELRASLSRRSRKSNVIEPSMFTAGIGQMSQRINDDVSSEEQGTEFGELQEPDGSKQDFDKRYASEGHASAAILQDCVLGPQDKVDFSVHGTRAAQAV